MGLIDINKKVEIINSDNEYDLWEGSVIHVEKEDDTYYYGIATECCGSFSVKVKKEDCKDYKGIEIVEFLKQRSNDKPEVTRIVKEYYDFFKCRDFINKYYSHDELVNTKYLWNHMMEYDNISNGIFYLMTLYDWDKDNDILYATKKAFIDEFKTNTSEKSVEFYISW